MKSGVLTPRLVLLSPEMNCDRNSGYDNIAMMRGLEQDSERRGYFKADEEFNRR